MQTELVIFDWDNTLQGTERKIFLVLRELERYFKTEVSRPISYEEMMAMSFSEFFQAAFPQLGHEKFTEFTQAYIDAYVEIGFIPAQENVESLLGQLSQAGTFIAVATNKSRKWFEIDLALSPLKHFIGVSHTSTEYDCKPNPIMLEEILIKVGVAARSSVLVGDSSDDERAASAIGLRFVQVGPEQPATFENILA